MGRSILVPPNPELFLINRTLNVPPQVHVGLSYHLVLLKHHLVLPQQDDVSST